MRKVSVWCDVMKKFTFSQSHGEVIEIMEGFSGKGQFKIRLIRFHQARCLIIVISRGQWICQFVWARWFETSEALSTRSRMLLFWRNLAIEFQSLTDGATSSRVSWECRFSPTSSIADCLSSSSSSWFWTASSSVLSSSLSLSMSWPCSALLPDLPASAVFASDYIGLSTKTALSEAS